ncbi:MAG: hypothetical protein WBE58_16895, partial [Verrucomicrobiales bacterium]
TSRLSGPTDFWLSSDYIDARVIDINNSGQAELTSFAGTVGTATRIPQEGTVRAYVYDTNFRFAKIGHGGYNFVEVNDNVNVYSLNNTIEVTAQTGDITFTAGDRDRDFIQIGHGGDEPSSHDGSIKGGDITVWAAGDIIFDASRPGVQALQRTTNLGPVERDGLGNVIGLGGVTERGYGFGRFAMIGNGGRDLDGDNTGNINITAGGNIHMIAPNDVQVNTVSNYKGNVLEGPSSETNMFGAAHTVTDLMEATMKARSFTLFHGTAGAATVKGTIVPGTVFVDSDNPDLKDDGLGNLVSTTASDTNIYGSVDYATGVVTIYDRVRTDDNSFQRAINYSYNNGATVQAIASERTPESDAALRANQAYLGHGGIIAGTVSLVIDGDNNGGGRQVITDHFQNGVLYNEQNVRVGQIDYTTGRIIIEGINSAISDSGTDGEFDVGIPAVVNRAALNSRVNPDEVEAQYSYSIGNSDQSFVQIGNGGYSADMGGRNSAGQSGEIVVTAGGNIRLHGGSFDNNSVQIGNGGRDSQGWHGYQTDQVDRVNPDFTVFDTDHSG